MRSSSQARGLYPEFRPCLPPHQGVLSPLCGSSLSHGQFLRAPGLHMQMPPDGYRPWPHRAPYCRPRARSPCPAAYGGYPNGIDVGVRPLFRCDLSQLGNLVGVIVHDKPASRYEYSSSIRLNALLDTPVNRVHHIAQVKPQRNMPTLTRLGESCSITRASSNPHEVTNSTLVCAYLPIDLELSEPLPTACAPNPAGLPTPEAEPSSSPPSARSSPSTDGDSCGACRTPHAANGGCWPRATTTQDLHHVGVGGLTTANR